MCAFVYVGGVKANPVYDIGGGVGPPPPPRGRSANENLDEMKQIIRDRQWSALSVVVLVAAAETTASG